MKCPICDALNDWRDINQLCPRQGFDLVMCNTCGFATYRGLNEERLRDMYRQSAHQENRKLAGTVDLFTKLKKLSQHRIFLRELLQDSPPRSVIDIGCSNGYLLKMLRDEFGCPEVCGTEWNPAHAAFGRYGYQLDIRRDIRDFGARRYDLISVMHVLEHILHPDQYLQEIVEKYLAPGGTVYLAMPVWFDILGMPAMTLPFEEGMAGLLAISHINICSRRHILRLCAKAGLQVVKENYSYYGYRALLKKTTGITPAEFDDPGQLFEILQHQKKSLEAYRQGRLDEALAAYPKFPQARLEQLVKKYPSACEESLQAALQALQLMPNVERLAWLVGTIYYELGQPDLAMRYFEMTCALNPPFIEAFWQMAAIFQERGDVSRAWAVYLKILEQRPDLQFEPLHPGLPTALDMLSQCCNRMS